MRLEPVPELEWRGDESGYGDSELELRDSGDAGRTRSINCEIGALGNTVLGLKEMEGVVVEAVTGVKHGAFPDDPLPFDSMDFASAVGNDPFSGTDSDRFARLVSDSYVIGVTMWLIRIGVDSSLIGDVVHRDRQSF